MAAISLLNAGDTSGGSLGAPFVAGWLPELPASDRTPLSPLVPSLGKDEGSALCSCCRSGSLKPGDDCPRLLPEFGRPVTTRTSNHRARTSPLPVFVVVCIRRLPRHRVRLRPVRRNLLAGEMPRFVWGCFGFGTGAAPAPGRLPPVALSPSIDFDLGVLLCLLWNLPRQLPHEFLSALRRLSRIADMRRLRLLWFWRGGLPHQGAED